LSLASLDVLRRRFVEQ